MFKSTEEVLAWFGNRGVRIAPATLTKWHWQGGKLYYVIEGGDEFEILNTEPGTVDVTYTHGDDGRALRIFEPYSNVAVEQSPFAS